MSQEWRNDPQVETRSQLVWRHAHELINRSATSWPTFAAEVREHYYASVPEPMRRLEFSIHRDAFKRTEQDAQYLRRFEYDRKWGLPADLEEAMVEAMACLGYPRIGDLHRELAARYGMLAAPIPRCDLADDADGIRRLMKETGEAIAAVLEIAPDGITAEDAPKAKEALRQIYEAQGELMSMAERIRNIIPGNQTPVVRLAQ